MPYLPSERRPPSRRNGISLPSTPPLSSLPPSSRTAVINQFFTSKPNRQPAGSPRHLEKRRLFQAANLPVARLLARSLALSLSYAPRRRRHRRRRCFERRLDSCSAQPRSRPTRYGRRGGRGRETLSARDSFRSGVPEAPLLKRRPSLVSGLSLLLGSALRGYGQQARRARKQASALPFDRQSPKSHQT